LLWLDTILWLRWQWTWALRCQWQRRVNQPHLDSRHQANQPEKSSHSRLMCYQGQFQGNSEICSLHLCIPLWRQSRYQNPFSPAWLCLGAQGFRNCWVREAELNLRQFCGTSSWVILHSF
jgi:hypothetical protein